jgi:hypothetical protein
MAALPPAPARVLDDGVPAFGKYSGAFGDVDLAEAKLVGWPGRRSRWRFKQWEHWLVVHPEVALSLAVVDVAFTRLLWVQAIDRRTGERWEHRREGFLVSARIARALHDAHTRGEGGGLTIAIHNHLAIGEHRLHVRAESRGIPAIDVDLHAACGPTVAPLSVVLPVGRGRAMVSHKVPLPVRGTVRVGERRFDFDPAVCTAVLDVHKAHYPHRTFWTWATAVGRDAAGRRVAFNLTRNVVPDDAPNENATWVDGQLGDLGPATFTTDADPWTAGTADGAVALTFAAQGERREDLNYGLIVSRFRQRFGVFTGTLRHAGAEIRLVDAFGLFEDHVARW